MTKEEIRKLRRQYPEYITKDQMYRICHISKRTCLFLLESGLVPCHDSHNKTRRFKILLDDVIQYMQCREAHPDRYLPPAGYYKGNPGKRHTVKPLLRIRARSLSEEECMIIRKYYENRLEEQPDVMTAWMISEFTGYGNSAVINWCKKGYLKSFFIGQKYQIPKEYLLDYLVSEKYRCKASRSREQCRRDEEIEELLKKTERQVGEVFVLTGKMI